MSIPQLSSMSDISATTLENYEEGRSGPSVPSIISLADALDVSTDYLLGRWKKYDVGTVGSDDFLNLKVSISSEGRGWQLFRNISKLHATSIEGTDYTTTLICELNHLVTAIVEAHVKEKSQ